MTWKKVHKNLKELVAVQFCVINITLMLLTLKKLSKGRIETRKSKWKHLLHCLSYQFEIFFESHLRLESSCVGGTTFTIYVTACYEGEHERDVKKDGAKPSEEERIAIKVLVSEMHVTPTRIDKQSNAGDDDCN